MHARFALAALRAYTRALLAPVAMACSKTYAAKAALLAPKINAMIDALDEGDDGQIQSLGAELRAIIIKDECGYMMQIHHSEVGVDPGNRNGEMLVPLNVHNLIRLICRKGFAWPETANALASEVPPGADGDEYRRENEELIEKAEGLLAPIQVEIMRVGTGAGSHTTAVLKLSDYAGKGGKIPIVPGNEHLGVDGFYSRQRIEEVCPTLKEPTDKGLTYFVIRWQLAALCPKLLVVLSEADNAKHSNYQRETWLQTMFNAHDRSLKANATTEGDFKKIGRQVARSHPVEAQDDVEAMTEFVRLWSGGRDREFLEELNAFQKTLKVQRDIPGGLFADLNTINVPSFGPAVIAIVKATMSAPENFARGGKAKVFKTADIKQMLTTKRGDVIAAMAIMVQSRDLAQQMGITAQPAWARISGILDSNLMMHVWTKTSPSRKPFKSLLHVAQACYDDLVNMYKQRASDIPSPWATVELASEMPSGSACSQGLRELNARGIMTLEMLVSMGFEGGTNVKTKTAEEKKYTIMSLEDGKATLVNGPYESDDDDEEKPEKLEMSFAAFVEGFTIDKEVPQELTTTPSKANRSLTPVIRIRYHNNNTIVQELCDIPDLGLPFDFSADLEKSHVKVALAALFDRSDCSRLVQLQTKPYKTVICTNGAKAREIRLVPLSTNLFQVDLKKVAASTATIETPLTDPRTGERMVLGVAQPKMVIPTEKKAHETPFVVPYWFLKPSSDLAEKNMDFIYMKVTVDIALPGEDKPRKKTIQIPVMTNIVSLKPNSELIIYKAQKRATAEAVGPAPKMAKVGQPTVKAKAKAKPKGKGKGRR